ncbi:MAG: hypothetical protein E3J72_18455 [Planctomycetota bacterium]|nr:MAG: hypothetical protein E3J72_18455 [Planctomycetota bacterium]
MNPNIFNAQSWAANYLEYWEKSISEWQENVSKYSQEFTDSYKSFVTKFAGGNFLTAYNDLFSGAFGKTTEAGEEAPVFTPYNRVIEISDLYTKLFKSFNLFNIDGGADITEDMSAFLGNWVETQKSLFSKMFKFSLPSSIVKEGDLGKFAANAFETYRNMFKDTVKYIPEQAKPYFEDYLDLLEKSSTAIEGINDPAKFTELFGTWRNVFNKSFDQFLEVVEVGTSKDFASQLKNEADSFFRYITASNEVFVNLYKSGLDSITATGKKAEGLFKEASPDNIRDFYGYLVESLDKDFFGFFKSKQFNDAISANFNAFQEFRTKHIEMLQSVFSNANFGALEKESKITPKGADAQKQTKPKTGKVTQPNKPK